MALPIITVQGNLVADPELRFTGAGTAVCTIRVAANERYKDKTTGEWTDGKSLFITASSWGPAGEEIANQLHRGAKVIVTGKLHSRSWETKDGTRRSVIEVADATVARLIEPDREQARTAPSDGDPWDSAPAPLPADDEPPF